MFVQRLRVGYTFLLHLLTKSYKRVTKSNLCVDLRLSCGNSVADRCPVCR